jgi:hypothetical protein
VTVLPALPVPADGRLRCVAIPLRADDVEPKLAPLFALWDDDRFLPRLDPRAPLPQLLVVVNKAGPDLLERIAAMFHARPRLAQCFAGIAAHSAGLEGDRDLYARDATRAVGAFGNKAGPNFLFQATMVLAGRHGGWVLQIETDCLPVQAGWLDATQQVIDGGSRAWVIGSVFAGGPGLDPSIRTHLNGNALYKAGDPAFQTFLSEVWIASILEQVGTRPYLAYDFWWALETDDADSRTGNASWRRFQTYDSFFRNDPFVVNLLAEAPQARNFVQVFDRFAALGRMPVFFHGPAMNTLLPQLLEHPGDSMIDAIGRLAGSGSGPSRPLRMAAGAVPMRPAAGGDMLTRLATRAAAGEGGADTLLLIFCAAALLLDPAPVLARLDTDPDLAAAIQQAQASAVPAVAEHFARVCAHARPGAAEGAGE